MAHYNLGVALQGLRRYPEAEIAYRRTISLKPESANALVNLSAVLHELGRSKEALESATLAVSLNPESSHAQNNLGLSLKDEGRYQEAIHCFQQALKINSRMAEARYNLGLTCYALGKTDDAIECFRQALAINSEYAEAYSDLGVAHQAQGNLPEALRCYDRALELRPDIAEAHWNRALARLLTGDFENGWPDYEWRWRRKEWSQQTYPGPRWDGSSIQGKRLFISAEQGLGDTIQFVRYLPLVKQLGGNVIFECQPELFSLLQHCEGIDHLIQRGDTLPPFDMRAHLLDLPGIFKTTLDTIPCAISYLKTPVRTRIDPRTFSMRKDILHVGMVWAGNPAHTNDRNRSCPPACFELLANVPHVQLFNLQKGERSSELKTHAFARDVIDLGDLLADFADTAAALGMLDLLVTVDTSVAHLAGAMGRPVWLLLPFASDWRWLQNREDSPWYPTMRLFRQNRPGDWDEVFERVHAALTTLATHKRRAAD